MSPAGNNVSFESASCTMPRNTYFVGTSNAPVNVSAPGLGSGGAAAGVWALADPAPARDNSIPPAQAPPLLLVFVFPGTQISNRLMRSPRFYGIEQRRRTALNGITRRRIRAWPPRTLLPIVLRNVHRLAVSSRLLGRPQVRD